MLSAADALEMIQQKLATNETLWPKAWKDHENSLNNEFSW